MDIRNSISLKDNMTPVLRKIMKAMDSTLKAMDRMNKSSSSASKDFERASRDIQVAQNALIQFSNHAEMAAQSSSQIGAAIGAVNPALGAAYTVAKKAFGYIESAVGKITQSFERLGFSASSFVSTLAHSLYSIEKIGSMLSDFFSSVDMMQSQVSRAGLFSTSMTGEDMFTQAYHIAQATRSSLEETMKLANKVMLSGVFKTQNAEKSLRLTQLINETLIAGGETADANRRALLQFNQALASGIMQGDELRSLREQSPYLMKVLAEGLGKIDERFEGLGIGDLKKLGAEGELTSARIIAAFDSMSDEIHDAFMRMPKTFGQGTEVLQNWWKMFLRQLSLVGGPLERLTKLYWKFIDALVYSEKGQKLLGKVAAAFDLVAQAIEWLYNQAIAALTWLSEHIEIVQSAVLGLAGVIAIAAGAMAISFMMMYWPIILVGAVFSKFAYDVLEKSASLEEALGIIGGKIGYVAGIIASQIIPFILRVIALFTICFTSIGAVVTLVGIKFAQVKWQISNIVDEFMMQAKMLVQSFLAVFDAVATGISNIANIVSNNIMGLIKTAAAGIDALAGTDISSKVAAVDNFVDKLKGAGDIVSGDWKTNALQPLETYFQGRQAQVENTKTMIEDMKNAAKLGASISKFGYDIGVAANGLADNLSGISAQDWEKQGAGIGGRIGNIIENTMMGWDPQRDLSEFVDVFGTDGIENIDKVGSVGKIDSDVTISEEDLKLLRDMAARDYLLQLQQVTPVANVTFGDVRETADVNRIMEVIENMVEEQLATSMVS